ncbi:unnamed protein product [Rhizophagus irregularis]|nr:unnamed protein product [Rhizophagus irregularis]
MHDADPTPKLVEGSAGKKLLKKFEALKRQYTIKVIVMNCYLFSDPACFMKDNCQQHIQKVNKTEQKNTTVCVLSTQKNAFCQHQLSGSRKAIQKYNLYQN